METQSQYHTLNLSSHSAMATYKFFTDLEGEFVNEETLFRLIPQIHTRELAYGTGTPPHRREANFLISLLASHNFGSGKFCPYGLRTMAYRERRRYGPYGNREPRKCENIEEDVHEWPMGVRYERCRN